MTCTTCNGNGHVAGRWMPELCPECSGVVDEEPMDKPDADAIGAVIAFVGVAVTLVLVIVTAAVWSLLA